ncbi:MAG TPA: LytR C-terminal domain-containing protein [Nocardioidaceae bacterium]|nr:LytR C-terminal domain-containing protein [Nocardioidaceae bacterium]
MRVRSRDERGIALPSPVTALSLGAVVLAGAAFFATSGNVEERPEATRPVTATPTPTPTATASKPVITQKPSPKPKPKKPTVRRGDVYVEVYNNSGISGLAGDTASKLSGAGWQVVGSDNWYGTIPSSTVYYPQRLAPAAKMLARDLGIKRLKPAISPMRFDRLTVILTGDRA